MRNKYKAKKTTIDNITFHSKAEAARYVELNLMLEAHQISDLELQPKYLIFINGIKVCSVILDFKYYDKRLDRFIIEDVKGKDTPISRLKRKLVEAAYGIKVILT